MKHMVISSLSLSYTNVGNLMKHALISPLSFDSVYKRVQCLLYLIVCYYAHDILSFLSRKSFTSTTTQQYASLL